jgi:hypothetical protein
MTTKFPSAVGHLHLTRYPGPRWLRAALRQQLERTPRATLACCFTYFTGRLFFRAVEVCLKAGSVCNSRQVTDALARCASSLLLRCERGARRAECPAQGSASLPRFSSRRAPQLFPPRCHRRRIPLPTVSDDPFSLSCCIFFRTLPSSWKVP